MQPIETSDRASAPPGLPALGSAAQDYLKAIYKLRQAHPRVTPGLLAETLAVSPPAVTKMLRRLQELRLIRYVPSQELLLTQAGEKIALEMIRHHRLLELYLAQALGYSWDQVDGEAERLEHHISEEFEDRIDALLGFPTHDPHGDPIPTREGHVPLRCDLPLSRLAAGQRAVVRRVTDGDPELLRYLAELGLFLETSVELLDRAPFGGPLRLRIAEREHAVGPMLADHVFVALVEEAAELDPCV